MSTKRLAKIVNYDDARARARAVLPKPIFDYVDGGAEDGITMARNIDKFHELTFRPRMSIENPAPDLSTTVFGERVAMPVITAPCSVMRVINPEGDLGVARAAAGAGIIYTAPAAAGFTMEEVAHDHEGPKWFQLYRFHSRAMMEHLVGRAQEAGYGALVVTVDTTASGNRERDTHNGFSNKWRVDVRSVSKMAPHFVTKGPWVYRYLRDGRSFTIANTAQLSSDGKSLPLTEMARSTGESNNSPTWEEIAWIRDNWKGPLLVKGTLTGDDARRAVEYGVNGVVVSNHGGRQLDGAPATIEVLPEIVAAVGNQAEVFLDSGVRRGADVIKAVALGARAVLIGRMAVWGLAAGGQLGVERMLSIIRTDLVRTMRLLGATAISELDESWLRR